MLEQLVDLLEITKVDMEWKGLDFEGDLVRLYGDLRKMMAEKYWETDFCLKEVIEPTAHVEEMNKEEIREYKRWAVVCSVVYAGHMYALRASTVWSRTGLSSYRSHVITCYFHTYLM